MVRWIVVIAACWYAALFLMSGPTTASEKHKVADSKASSPLPRGHATWVYDVTRSAVDGRRYDPAYHANAINRFNRGAVKRNRISTVYTYAGSLELYCPERDASRCEDEHMVVIYPLQQDAALRSVDESDTVEAYRDKLEPMADQRAIRLVPVIDGVINADYAGSLKGMSELSERQAAAFADKLARALCSRDSVAGVQMDLEPLSLAGRNGQYHFYRRLAKNLAGTVPASGGHEAQACRNASYPQGRFFSVFASSNRLNPDTEEGNLLAEVLSAHSNGYLIAPLYDLGDGAAGQGLSLSQYQQRAERHVRQAKQWAKHHGVSYQLAVPAAATVHEFDRCSGERCREAAGSVSQRDYLEAALAAIDRHRPEQDEEFLGLAIWAWTRGIEHHGMRFYPATPKWSEVETLQQR